MVGQPLLAPASHKRKWLAQCFHIFQLLEESRKSVFEILATHLNFLKSLDKLIQSVWPGSHHFVTSHLPLDCLLLRTFQSLHGTCVFWVLEHSFPTISFLSLHGVRAIADTNGVFVCSLAGFLVLSFMCVYCRESRKGDEKRGCPSCGTLHL